eukprot:8230443-Ditylum_brightwellii.AAC.1
MANLLTLQNELQANTQAVITTLGGGRHGHLGLVMTPQDYALIPSTTAYLQPPQPLLILPQNDIQHQITQAKEQYYDELRMFNERNTVKKIFIQQIVDAINAKYVTTIRDPVTYQIMLTIPDIIDHFFDSYGAVTAEELRELWKQVEQLPYQPTEHVDTIFTKTDMLAEVAKIAKRPLTQEQTIDMAYLLLQKTR